MPPDAPIGQDRGLPQRSGATVRRGRARRSTGCVVDRRASARAQTGMVFVHPFDDPDVVAGQGTSGWSCSSDVPDLAKVVVPVGGGGLAAGVAIAVEVARPEIEVVGVQVETRRGVPRLAASAASRSRSRGATTIADGIAVKRPGELTLDARRALARRRRGRRRGRHRRGDGAADGAGEARRRGRRRGRRGRAARRRGDAPRASGATVRRPQRRQRRRRAARERRAPPRDRAGRRLVVLTRVAGPARRARRGCWTASPRRGANIVDVEHLREGVDLHVRETGVQLIIETRGERPRRRGARGAARARLRGDAVRG